MRAFDAGVDAPRRIAPAMGVEGIAVRTLLVAPRFVSRPGEYYEFPLGLCYVSSCLKAAGFEVECLNLNHVEASPEAAVGQAVRNLDIDLVMTGGLTAHYHAVRQVLQAARRARPDVLAVAGGGLVSSEPELMLQALELTAGVVGEGEVTAVALLECLSQGRDLATVPGLVHRAPDGSPRRTGDRPLLEDLDQAPFPDYEAFGVERYLDLQLPGDSYYHYLMDKPRLLPIISSRSCPYNCTFCYHPLGKKYRRRSVDAFFRELDIYRHRHGITMLAVLDELFPTQSPWLEEFCEAMGQRDVRWIAQLRVENMDRKTLQTLKDSGMFYISYGIESASPAILRSMRKHIVVEQVDQALALTREMQVGIQGNLLFGDPAETPATARESLDWWARNSRYHLAMNFVIPYPGSAIYQQSVERGIIPDRLAFIEQGCPPPNMTAMSDEELDALAGRIAALKVQGRMFAALSAEETGWDARKGAMTHRLRADCPQCGAGNAYEGFCWSRLEVFKLSCRHCNQRFDCSPLAFPHLAARVREAGEALREAARTGRPVAGTPALFRPTFEECLELLGVAFDQLDWRFFLDDRPRRQGLEYAPGAFVRPFRAESLADAPADLAVVTPPCHGWEAIVRRLREECGLGEASLIHAAL